VRLVALAIVAGSLAGLLGLSGCGLKGPLYLPEKTGDVVVRPAAGTTPPAETPPPETEAEPEVAPPGDAGG
jgi:predicted small lipoprotein YifL